MKVLSREQFLEEFESQWLIGEHVTIIGTTGSGKTVLAEDIYALRKFVVVIATKSSDDSLDDYDKQFHRLKRWPPSWHQEKVLFWKRPEKLGDFTDQRLAIYEVISHIYKHGNRVLGFDDVFYISDTLKLSSELQMLYTQARSQKVSLVGNLQRPFWVPKEITNQASHVLLFGLRDDKDVERVAGAQGIKKQDVIRAVDELQKYDFAWIRTGVEPVIVRGSKDA